MLLSFRVSNFRSFRDAQDLDLRRYGHRSAQLALDEWDDGVSAVAAIYGPNAGGKSTCVDAFGYFRHVVRNSYAQWELGDKTGRSPFKLDDHSINEPTEFDIEFIAEDKIRYRYGFSIDDDEIVAEWLYQYRTPRQTVLFERGFNEEEFFFGSSFGAYKSLLQTVRPNSLILSAANAADHRSLRAVNKWIRTTLQVYSTSAARQYSDYAAQRSFDDGDYASKVLNFVRNGDLGILDGRVEEREVPEAQRNQMLAMLKLFTSKDSPDDSIPKTRHIISLSHQSESGSTELDFDEESGGTQALFGLASLCVDAIENGEVCVFDELDTSLHPMIVASIVDVFRDPITNPKQAQLIFTTHDISLLGGAGPDSAGIDRDQVWFVEKDRTGASELMPLSDYKPRVGENIFRGYVTGRYGGLPAPKLARAFRDLEGEA
ncbi:AAA family ATPase [Rhodococcus qingshengii]|uniref:AAA family ATPase n=1 Tax=Rhodococcus qingshengii TaxID=334542 RepID=UPI001ADFB738|nr:ATP-binding protein [Rhodococcus qingshengii]